jgi:hypothetical protein
MDVCFADISDGDAARLAHELRLELLKAGVPGDAVGLKPSSDEHMDLGSVLWANIDLAAHLLGATGYIACFGKCIYEVLHRNNVTIRISTPQGSVEIPANATAEVIEKALAELNKERPAN